MVTLGTKMEWYETADTNNCYVYVDRWEAQIFHVGTVGRNVEFLASYLKLKTWKYGAPPATAVFTYSIRAVNTSHQPTGSDLCSGSVDMSSWTTAQTWKTLKFTSKAKLSRDTDYAICMRSPISPNAANCAALRYNSGNVYAGGHDLFSDTAGATWTNATNDFVFDVYGWPISDRAFNTLMDTCRRAFHVASFDVTSSALTLGATRDSVTGWYPKGYTDTASHMVIIQKESQKLALDLGYWVSLDAVGFTVDGAEVYDLVTDSFGRTWIVEAVKPIIVGDTVQFFVCDLKELSVYGG